MSLEPVTIGDDEIDPLADPIISPMKPNQGISVGLKTTSVKRVAGVMTNNEDSSAPRESILPLYHGISQLDQNSTEGKFTWIPVNNKGYLPEVIRYDPSGKIEKFVSVKMAEKGFIGQFMKNLPYEVMAKIANISSHKVTEAEAILLNEINARHCDNSFGKNESFVRDLLVKSDEFVNFYTFLNLCSDKMVLKKSQVGKDKCGFLRIAGASDVPYVLIDDKKYLPMFYFEGEVGSMKRKEISSWDWAYLKFCCKIQGVKDDLLPKEGCPVIALDELQTFFSSDTTYTEYWPSKDFLNKIFSKKTTMSGSWAKLVLNHGKKFQGKLTSLRDFPVQPNGEPAYKAERALIDKKRINAINTRPYQFNELLVTLPHLVEQLFPNYSEDQVGTLLENEGILLYRGNNGHKDVLIAQGWDDDYKELPLVTVKDLVNNLLIIKSCLKGDGGGKRFKGI